MEKCCITNNINMRIVFDVFAKTLHCKFFCLWLTNVECDLFFHTLPVIDYCIVHMYRIPHNVCKKTYCIIMEFLCVVNCDISCLLTVIPLFYRNNFTCCTVNDFPPSSDIIVRIYFQHIWI